MLLWSMAKSLKSYVPRLAQLLNMTPDSLYERQRALVREGLLTPEPGRGPGSGVQLTPESVAILLIALLATDSLSRIADQIRDVANSTSFDFDTGAFKPCNLTAKTTFKDALVEILSDLDLARRVSDIDVERSDNLAIAGITYDFMAPPPPKKLSILKEHWLEIITLGVLRRHEQVLSKQIFPFKTTAFIPKKLGNTKPPLPGIIVRSRLTGEILQEITKTLRDFLIHDDPKE